MLSLVTFYFREKGIMTDSSTNSQNSTKKVYVYWDFQNIRFSRTSNPKTCIKFILSLAQLKGELQSARVYAYWRKERVCIEKEFNELGFDCLSLPDDVKNKVDRKIIQDCHKQVLQEAGSKVVILITGDSDFKPLVAELKSKQHQVIVVGAQQTSQKLKKVADCFCYLADCFCSLSELETLVSKKGCQGAPSEANKILYSDAVECLVKATELVLVRGQSARFPRVDTVMRQMNELYRGVSSIYTREGKKFKCFKDFVEFAAQEGKIGVKQNEQERELILV
ncbi:MAG: NYN domain-containing protein [Cyanobacteriota bacterium]|nr:NYN domain-containing protein [Cyanobacteriota bacterium]